VKDNLCVNLPRRIFPSRRICNPTTAKSIRIYNPLYCFILTGSQIPILQRRRIADPPIQPFDAYPRGQGFRDVLFDELD
jgi:hypothetical protein